MTKPNPIRCGSCDTPITDTVLCLDGQRLLGADRWTRIHAVVLCSLECLIDEADGLYQANLEAEEERQRAAGVATP